MEVTVGMSAANAFTALPLRGWPLGVILVARLAVAAFGLAAGLAIGNRRPSAVGMAQTALALLAVMDVIVYTSPYYPSNLVPGDAPLYVAASMAYHAGWIVYLRRSKRVERTFPARPQV